MLLESEAAPVQHTCIVVYVCERPHAVVRSCGPPAGSVPIRSACLPSHATAQEKLDSLFGAGGPRASATFIRAIYFTRGPAVRPAGRHCLQ